MQSGCRPCHEECMSCLDGSAGCGQLENPPCRHYRQGGDCVRQCSENFYIDQRRGSVSRRVCLLCHPECVSCTGPSEYHCTECRSLSVFEDSRNSSYIEIDDALVNSTLQTVGILFLYFFFFFFFFFL